MMSATVPSATRSSFDFTELRQWLFSAMRGKA
jgi:hypothetical protein